MIFIFKKKKEYFSHVLFSKKKDRIFFSCFILQKKEEYFSHVLFFKKKKNIFLMFYSSKKRKNIYLKKKKEEIKKFKL